VPLESRIVSLLLLLLDGDPLVLLLESRLVPDLLPLP
jgi:hypothetical protein